MSCPGSKRKSRNMPICVCGPCRTSGSAAILCHRKSVVDLESFENETLRGEPLFTREYIEAAKRHRDAAGAGWLLDWQGSWILASRPEDYSTQQVALRKPDNQHVAIRDLQAMQSLLANNQETWLNCDLCKGLTQQIRKAIKKMPRVDKIFCLGIGSISTCYNGVLNDDEVFNQIRNLVQHLAAVSIASTFDKEYASIDGEASPVRIIAQDPDYTTTDKELLSMLPTSIEVIDDPDGLLSIDEHTLVMFCTCPIPIYEIMADLASANNLRPAAIIGNVVYSGESFKSVTVYDDCTPRVLKFLKGHDWVQLNIITVEETERENLWYGKPWLWDLEMGYRKGDGGSCA